MTDHPAVTSPQTAAFEAARAAQARAAEPTLSAWVEANAGSGKTKVLIDRVARLLLARPDGRPGAAPDSILCITYTKAAANEMMSRLFSTLGDWSVARDEALRGKLATLEGRAPEAYDSDALRQARALFARALETPGGLRIETIHAFCARILRRFPLEAQVSPGFTEIEDAEADEIWQAILASRLEAAAEADPEALRALSQTAGGLGASAALDALKFKRQQIASFARRLDSKAPGALTDIIRAALKAPQDTPAQIISTAMGEALPRSELDAAIANLEAANRKAADDTLLAGLRDVLGEPDPAKSFALYLKALGGDSGSFSEKSNPYTKAAGAIVSDLFCRDTRKGEAEGREITRLKAAQVSLASAEAAERTIALLTIGLPMVAAYTEEKRRRAALDFDDLIAHTRRLLTRSHAAQWVLYKLDGGLTHILLDEAQDTSPQQWDLINALVAEFQAGSGRERQTDPRTQFVVGDPKQSIYSFQGASEEHFRSEKAQFMQREAPLCEAQGRAPNLPEMAMSFRSTPQVLAFVDAVREHVPLNDDTTQGQPPVDADLTHHEPRRANQPGRVELWPLEYPQPRAEGETHWSTPLDHIPEDAPRRRLANRIARTVRIMIDRGDTVWREQPDGTWRQSALRPDDVLILVRRRNDLFDALIDSLKQQGLPVAGADRLMLQDNLGVQDCLNLIRFALQPADDLTLAEILRGPFCGLTDDDNHLFRLAYARGHRTTLWQSLQRQSDPVFAPARVFCDQLLARRHLPAYEFIAWVLNNREPGGLSGWDRLIQRLGEPARDPVQALTASALGHDMAEPTSLQAFLARTERQTTELKRDLGEPEGAIRVMTIHGAKGLQAPLVILPDTTGATRGVTDPVFFDSEGTPLYAPSSRFDCAVTADLRERANKAGERESRRLLYVALTRACDRLIVCGAAAGRGEEGFAKSSWYRWCLLGMNAVRGGQGGDDQTEAGPPETLVFGADLPRVAPFDLGADRTRPDTGGNGPAWLRSLAAAPAPPMRLAAPSRLLEDRARVSEPFGSDRAASLCRGQLIHALLQTLPLVPDSQREAAARRFLARDPALSHAAAQEMLETTMATLNAPGFAAIFDTVGRSEAAIVGTLPTGQMVNGRVDRLRIDTQEILIVDYKTDRPAPRDETGIHPAYIVQMAAYRAVLRQVFTDTSRAIRCAILYTDGPRLIELSEAGMTESLNRVKSAV